MRVQVYPVSPWQANCYLLAADSSEELADIPCLLVDPGITAFEAVSPEIEQLGWQPVAILLTHGHLDHVGDAHKFAAHYQIPVYCAAADQPMLVQPSLGLGRGAIPVLQQLLGGDALPLPADLRELAEPFEAAGLSITPVAAPGHTEGSTLLQISDGAETLLLTGDVIFAGSIGRCDLPGGNMTTMKQSLRRILERYGDDIALLPGHGPGTTLGEQKISNQFLQPNLLESNL